MYRLIGMGITMAVIGYIFYMMNTSDTMVENTVNNSASVQEQKKVLEDAGINTSDKKVFRLNALKQAKQIRAYQDQPAPE